MIHYGNIEETPIQTFYAGQSIFITGGTGFLGRVLIEKLLRSCPNVSKIYIMIRAKKNKNVAHRMDEIFESPLFDRLKEEIPNFRDKVVPMVSVGDVSEKDLGLKKDDIDLLIRKVSILFHLMATIRFNENMHVAAKINVFSTSSLLNLAKRMPNLKSFIHVSTIMSNCHTKHINEIFYKYPIDSEEFITLMKTSSESKINEKILRVASQWPNIYTFTKAIAEILVKDNSENLPVGIFRPSIVSSIAREPLVGWQDNFAGALGVLAPFSKGLLRFCLCNSNCVFNLVPVDITINTLIAAAWDVFNQPHRRGDKMLIYNSISCNDALLTFNDYFTHARLNSQKYPMKDCYWMPTITLIRNKVIYRICIWFGHVLPALLIDTFQICANGRQRILKLYNKINSLLDVLSPFMLNHWTHTDMNVPALWQRMSKRDQFLFNFNMKGFGWPKYLEDHFKGMRFYLLKDDFSTLEASRIKWKRLYWIHQATKFVLIFIFFILTWELFANIIL